MAEQFSVLALPFVACLILTGIHAYLGIHVLSRKVIFVDIALAQIAALGATVAFLLGHDPRSEGAYYFSLTFAVLAAAVFALTRTRVERIPQEAIIGLTYAVASGSAILLADISPHGAEHLKDLLAGSIVWVTPHQIIKTGILYGLIGAFHFVYRKTFLLISMDPEEAFRRGIRVRLWDFLFYLSFGVVITSSVQIAGVLLVFCYLVAPAVFAFMFSDNLRTRLALGWGAGTVVSALGLLFSYDRPSGPTIMVCFALALVLGAIVKAIAVAPSRPRAAALAAACAVLVVLLCGVVYRLGLVPGPDVHEHSDGSSHPGQRADVLGASHEVGTSAADLRLALRDSHSTVRAHAIEGLAAMGDRSAVPEIGAALKDASAAVRESAARSLGALGDAAALPALLDALNVKEDDEWVRLRLAESVVLLGHDAGIPALLDMARSAEAKVVRETALSSLLAASGGRSGSPDGLGRDAPDEQLEMLARWWKQHSGSLKWDPVTRTFLPNAQAR